MVTALLHTYEGKKMTGKENRYFFPLCVLPVFQETQSPQPFVYIKTLLLN